MKKSYILLNLLIDTGFGIFVGAVFPFFSILFVDIKEGYFFYYQITCIAAGLFIGILSYMISRLTIIRVIKLIREQLTRINSGNGDLTERLSVESEDDLGQMVNNVNLFFDSTHDLVHKIKGNALSSQNKSSEVLDLSHELLKDVRLITERQSKIADNSSELDKIVVKIDKVIQRILTASAGFARQVNEDKENLDRGETFFNSFFSNMDSIVSGFERQDDGMGNMTKEIELSLNNLRGTVENIESVKSSHAELSQELHKINEVVEQTNMLAMNASIEAAHAGEAGKGFSVIAEEIHKLSMQVHESIESINKTTDELAENINTGLKSSQDSDKSLKVIRTEINQTVEEFTSIKVNFKEMRTIRDELKKITDHMRGSGGKTAGYFDQLKKNVDEVAENNQNALRLAEASKLSAEENRRYLYQFLEAMYQIIEFSRWNVVKAIDLGENVSYYQTKGKSLTETTTQVLWQDSFATGSSEIDEELKLIINLLNRLINEEENSLISFGGAEGQTTLADEVLSALLEATNSHFKNEEDMMKRYQYPDIEQHREEHRLFIDRIRMLLQDRQNRSEKKETDDTETTDGAADRGISAYLLSELINSYLFWIIEHIFIHDKKVGFHTSGSPLVKQTPAGS